MMGPSAPEQALPEHVIRSCTESSRSGGRPCGPLRTRAPAQAMADTVVPKFVLALVLLVLTVLSFWHMEDLTHSLRRAIGSPVLRADRQRAGTISGFVRPASAVRCNRISLPARFYNESTGPYNPAAVRHPTSGEWYLFHTYDEVSPQPSWPGGSRLLHRGLARGARRAGLHRGGTPCRPLPCLQRPGEQILVRRAETWLMCGG